MSLTPVEGMAPATDAAGRTSDWISLKHVNRAWAVFHITQGHASTIALSLLQAVNVSGGSSKAGPALPIHSNLDTAASDALVARTPAASYTTDAGVKNKIVIFDGDAERLTGQLLDIQIEESGGFSLFGTPCVNL
jgi:hypothetical protein